MTPVVGQDYFSGQDALKAGQKVKGTTWKRMKRTNRTLNHLQWWLPCRSKIIILEHVLLKIVD